MTVQGFVILILPKNSFAVESKRSAIIIGNDDERQQYRDFFERKLTDEHLSKLNNHQEYETESSP